MDVSLSRAFRSRMNVPSRKRSIGKSVCIALLIIVAVVNGDEPPKAAEGAAPIPPTVEVEMLNPPAPGGQPPGPPNPDPKAAPPAPGAPPGLPPGQPGPPPPPEQPAPPPPPEQPAPNTPPPGAPPGPNPQPSGSPPPGQPGPNPPSPGPNPEPGVAGPGPNPASASVAPVPPVSVPVENSPLLRPTPHVPASNKTASSPNKHSTMMMVLILLICFLSLVLAGYLIYSKCKSRKGSGKPYAATNTQAQLTALGPTMDRAQSNCKFGESVGIGLSQSTPQSDIVMLQKGPLSGVQVETAPYKAPSINVVSSHQAVPHALSVEKQSHDEGKLGSFVESYVDTYAMGESYHDSYSAAHSFASHKRISVDTNKFKSGKSTNGDIAIDTRDTSDSYAILGSSFGSTRDSRFSRLSRFSNDSHV